MQMEQQRAMAVQQEAQQQLLLGMLERQKEEKERQRVEMKVLLQESSGTSEAWVKVPKPMLQKLAPSDDMEHFWRHSNALPYSISGATTFGQCSPQDS